MSDKKINIGIIGLGPRAETLLCAIFPLAQKCSVQVTAICDLRNDRIERLLNIFAQNNQPVPQTFTDYHKMLEMNDLDAVIIPTSWNSHLQIARDAMAKGKYCAIEVGGAASIDELWQLVHAAESTGVSCMMLENCCYGRNELMVLNMVRKGLFGELIYCECGYEHDIGDEFARNWDDRIERGLHNLCRNGDLYPTHGLGPIAKILRINRGNRFMTISSHATKSRGLSIALERYAGKKGLNFNEGDVITSVIHCANGENITLTHCVSLPRPYSRDCRVQGTQGIWLENADGIYIDGLSPRYEKIDPAGNPYIQHEWNKTADFYDKYDHPIWKNYHENIIGGHDGMDALALQAFFDAVSKCTTPPIDIYDCASWMAVTCLSEQSIALGGQPVAFPDFTNGKWICREKELSSKWSLNEIYE